MSVAHTNNVHHARSCVCLGRPRGLVSGVSFSTTACSTLVVRWSLSVRSLRRLSASDTASDFALCLLSNGAAGWGSTSPWCLRAQRSACSSGVALHRIHELRCRVGARERERRRCRSYAIRCRSTPYPRVDGAAYG